MYYTIYATDASDSLENRTQARPAHIQRLQTLVDQGRLLAAGPNPAIDTEDPGSAGFTGSLIIAEFDSLEDAEDWANDDPFVAAGVYIKTEVKPWKKVLP